MKSGWHVMYKFDGKPTWEELNKLIAHETGNDDPHFPTEDDYYLSVKEGFVTFDGHDTIIWADGEQ